MELFSFFVNGFQSDFTAASKNRSFRETLQIVDCIILTISGVPPALNKSILKTKILVGIIIQVEPARLEERKP